MFAAYSRYRSLHDLMAILELAIPRVSPSDANRLRDCIEEIDLICESGAVLGGSIRVAELRREVLSRVRVALSRFSGGLL